MPNTTKTPATPDKKPSKTAGKGGAAPAKKAPAKKKPKAATAQPPLPAALTPAKGQRACTQADAEKIIALIADESISFSEACRRCGTNKGDSWRFIHSDKDLDTRYARAREGRGFAIGEQVEAIGRATLAGKYKPDVARVAMDAFKWSAAHMAPRHFGDHMRHEHTGPGGGAIPLAVFTPAQLANLSDIEIEQMIAIAAKLGLELPGMAVTSDEAPQPP